MPAEWERHDATWLTWPHRLSDWPRKFAPIAWVYGEIVRKLAPGEVVRILVPSAVQETFARRLLERVGVDLRQVEFLRVPLDRGWARDFGPIFVKDDAAREVAIARFRFNAWAKYPDWKKDDRVPERAARVLAVPIHSVEREGRLVVLEGGSIDVDGIGTLLTTEECNLDQVVQVRNPGLDRAGFEHVVGEALGITKVIWLGAGIAGDDTHGHVDDLCRFVSPGRVVLCRERDSADANYRPLEENRERLRAARDSRGERIDVVELPMPRPVVLDGQRLPASYANFYIANAAVLVPTFNDPADREALGILAEQFPDRPVIGIHAVDLVWGLGTLHCLTQQQPSV
jgi:agmatine deiminase